MKRLTGLHKALAVLLLGSLCLLVPLTSCAGPAFSDQSAPVLLPAAYYQCYDVTPKAILAAYFDPYGHRWQAEEIYNNQPFIFKNVEVDAQMLKYKGENFIWVDQIKCVAVSPGEVSKLKKGQMIDVVGLNRGIPNNSDMANSMLMEECYFLPAGSLALPLSGGGGFVAGY